MEEVFPVLAGLALGLVFSGRPRNAGTLVAMSVLAVLAALTASAISGELGISLWYFAVDLLEVSLAAAVACAFAPALGRRMRRRSS
jgi:hypothetical protein